MSKAKKWRNTRLPQFTGFSEPEIAARQAARLLETAFQTMPQPWEPFWYTWNGVLR